MAKISTIVRAKTQLAAVKALTLIIPAKHPLVFAGQHSSLNLCDNISQLGMKHVLIVTDAVLVKLGMIQPIEDRLKKLNLSDGILV